MQSVFPSLNEGEIKFSWKDESNEYVTFSSNDELRDAIESNPPNKKVIDVYVKVCIFTFRHFLSSGFAGFF